MQNVETEPENLLSLRRDASATDMWMDTGPWIMRPSELIMMNPL